MPNYVLNEIKIEGDAARISQLLQKCKTSECDFDFNAIIPMPKSLDMTSGTSETTAIAAYLRAVNPKNPSVSVPNVPKVTEAELERMASACYGHNWLEKAIINDPKPLSDTELAAIPDGRQYIENAINYGHTTWYGWCCEHWNTKWNACDIDVDEPNGTVRFNTAWSAPHPILKALAEQNPDLAFKYRWADEDTGSNTGVAEYGNGDEKCLTAYLSGSKEAYENCFDLYGTTPEAEGYAYSPVIGSYVYMDGDGPDSIWDEVPLTAEPYATMAVNGTEICVMRRVNVDNEREAGTMFWSRARY